MVDLDEPLFSISQVVRALGENVRNNTIQSWFQRGHFTLNAGDTKGDRGAGHRLSLRSALQVGIAWHLYDSADVHPATGATIAREFTDLGDSARNPGELYSKDLTVLIAFPKLRKGVVVNCTSKTPLLQLFQAEEYGRQYAAVSLWLNFIDRDLRVALLQGGKGSSDR